MKNENLQNGKRGFAGFVSRHKGVSFLFLLVLVVFLWAVIKMFFMERHFKAEKKQLAEKYDSLAVSNLELTARTFSWAIRSEMTRENLEQVNQFFINLVKEPGIRKLQLIDAPSAKILLSSDKKEEGTAVKDAGILEAESTTHQANDSTVKIITPVMGLNSKIAILVMEIQKTNSKL